ARPTRAARRRTRAATARAPGNAGTSRGAPRTPRSPRPRASRACRRRVRPRNARARPSSSHSLRERRPDLLHRKSHTAFHRAQGHTKRLGYLGMTEAAEVGQLDHLELVRWKHLEDAPNLARRLLAQRLRIRQLGVGALVGQPLELELDG